MKTINLLFAIVIFATLNLKFGTLNCKAQTSIPAGNVSGTWTLAGSPYNVLGNISIPNGTTLTIQPGVTINFQGTYKFNIQGRLLAIGTVTDTITFTAANITNGWLGIRFNNTPTTNDSSKIIYCKLQYGKALSSFPDDRGGAFYFDTFSKTVISNCRISNCTAAYNGGGICCYYCSPKIVYNTISDNTASINGGGIYCNSYSPNISNNTISNNTASNGGGIYCHAGAILSNNIISNNTASNYGGGIYFSNVSPVITNNTISNNNAIYGGGIVFDIISSPTLRNCILWGNAVSTSGSQIYIADNQSDPDFYYCNIQGGLDAFELNGNSHTGIYSNNIDSDPKFVSPSAGNGNGFNGVVANWSLQSNSPSINTGDPTGTYPATDIVGNTRVTVCRIDMGAYEYQNGTPLTATISQIQQNFCYGDTTATAIITPAGGASPYVYNYLWSNGQTVATATGLGAGTYTVTTTEASYGCSFTKTITISQPAQLTFTTTKVNVLCNNGSSGSITVNASGGTGVLQYSKNNGNTYQSSNVFTGLSAAGYQIVVKDANNCVTVGQGIIITEPALLSFTKTSTNVLCKSGNSGTITVTASGGTPALQYSNDGGSTYQASNVFTGLTANAYQIVVKDVNNCITAAQSVIVTEPTLLSFTKTSIDAICKNGNSGSITVSASGGTGILQYSKDNGSTYQLSNAFTGLTASTYQIIVKDANNCVTAAQSVIITEPALLAFTTTPSNVLCYNGNSGSITVNASGGTGTLQYSKDNGSTYQSSNAFTGLTASTYQIVVKDANNCITASTNIILSEPQASLSVLLSITDPICTNNNGIAEVTSSGGTAPYAYLWSTNNNSTTDTISSLLAGTYSVIVTDTNGCSILDSVTLVTQFPLLSIVSSSINPICTNNNGSAAITASGGIAPYSYLWSTNNNSTTDTISSLLAGTYSVTVTDSNGCSILDSVTLVTEFPSLSLVSSFTNASCYNNDGSASVIPNGGAEPYSYLWSNNSISQNLSNIGSGTYSVIATDTNGCVVSETFIINNSIAPISTPICMVTVDSSSTKNVIVWEKPTDAPIDSFRIYREIASVYTYVGSVPYDEVSEFTDNANGINPNTTSYKYKLSVLDTCGNESPLSTEHHTIHVQLGVAFPQGVNLSWNNYTGFTFSQYRILRDDLGNGNWQVIDSVSFGTTTYTSTDVLPNAQYIVEATRPTSCVSTRQSGTTRNSSKSNTASQTTGVNEVSNDLSLIIFPNPSNGKFTIELSSTGISNNNKFVVKIYNVLGEQIYLSELKQLTRNEIDLSNIPKGIYFVNVYNEDKIYTRKIVKQ
ncbi:MAG: T9SS type A sorting domain-containing protein [Bacteroidia bacterium]|nr:T9SS type A sorting domain-containing protein [Bacteroidia bacterium]